MDPKITSILLEGFRAFRKFEVRGFGHVNLITGRNNTGKSSLLEALRLLASNATLDVINSILGDREENLGESTQDQGDEELFRELSSLFCDFPQLSESPKPIRITTHGISQSMSLTVRLGSVLEKRDTEHRRRLVLREETPFGEDGGDLAVVVETENERWIWALQEFHYPFRKRRSWENLRESRMPCRFVGPYGGRRTATLAHLWDRVALSDEEKHVVRALHVIDDRITAVSMVGREGRPHTRTAIVRTNNIARPVPLRSFGDGLNRLFGIILTLVNAKDGLLLIDEFENGLHHTVQHDVWRIVFELARTLDIQVFATSHSWDAIEAFQRAAAEAPEMGALIRLTRKDDDIIPTVFTESELEVATRDRIEVR